MVIDGQPLGPDEFPWQAYLMSGRRNIINCIHCGGSLIRIDWVLTTAHWIKNTGPSDVSVSGFGWTENSGFLEDRLRNVDLLVISNQECRKTYGNKVTDSDLCGRGCSGQTAQNNKHIVSDLAGLMRSYFWVCPDPPLLQGFVVCSIATPVGDDEAFSYSPQNYNNLLIYSLSLFFASLWPLPAHQ